MKEERRTFLGEWAVAPIPRSRCVAFRRATRTGDGGDDGQGGMCGLEVGTADIVPVVDEGNCCDEGVVS